MLVSAIQHESVIIIYPLLLKPSHRTPLGCHRALSWAPCVIQQLPTSHMVAYMRQSCSLSSSCRLLPLLCQVCSLCLCPLSAGLNIPNSWGHALLNTPPDTWRLLSSECALLWLVEIWTAFCSVSAHWLPSCSCLVVLSRLPGFITYRCPSADDSKGPLRPPMCVCLCVCLCACAFLPYLCVCISSLFVQLSPVQYSACRSCLLCLLGLSFLSAHSGGLLCPEILCCSSSELGKSCGSPCLFPISWRSLVCSLSCVLSKSSCCTYIWTIFLVT